VPACARGTLDVLIHHSQKAEWNYLKLLAVVRNLALGIKYLHEHDPPILHRDIKPGTSMEPALPR
jgi:serine/threonine protein kinase